jgi:hypothetical protein
VGALLLALGVWRWSRRAREPAAEPAIEPELDARVDELLAKWD